MPPHIPIPAAAQLRKRLAEHSTQTCPPLSPGQGANSTSCFFQAISDVLFLPSGLTAPLEVAPGGGLAPWDTAVIWRWGCLPLEDALETLACQARLPRWPNRLLPCRDSKLRQYLEPSACCVPAVLIDSQVCLHTQ